MAEPVGLTIVLRIGLGACVLLSSLWPLSADAFPSGVATFSQSGCSSCHTGSNMGTRPTVALQGPSAVVPGSTNGYALVITGPSGITAGLDVTVEGGTLQPVGPTEQLLGTDLTQVVDQCMSDQSYTFAFQVVAGSGSSMTLYATGMSSNGDGTPLGDEDNQASMTVALDGSATASPPALAQPASAASSPLIGNSTEVSVGATGAALLYTWSSSGPASVNFSPNGTAAAASSTATFPVPGTYALVATVANGSGTLSSSVTVVVMSPFDSGTPSSGTPPAGSVPTVALTEPMAMQTVSGTIMLSATATAPAGVVDVTFGVDATSFAVVTASPYQAQLDTTRLSAGPHTLTAAVLDENGNSAISSVTITVGASPASGSGGCSMSGGALAWPSLLLILRECFRRKRRRSNHCQ
jgi:hypothetical protein